MSLLPTYITAATSIDWLDGRLQGQCLARNPRLKLFMRLSHGLAVSLFPPTMTVLAEEAQSLSVEQEKATACDRD